MGLSIYDNHMVVNGYSYENHIYFCLVICYTVVMINEKDTITEADSMSMVRSGSTLDAVKSAYQYDNPKTVSVSYTVRKGQKLMIEALSKATSETQAVVLRKILDEWAEMQLRETE